LSVQERKEEIIGFLAKNEGLSIKNRIIKMGKVSCLHPEKVMTTIFPDVLS